MTERRESGPEHEPQRIVEPGDRLGAEPTELRAEEDGRVGRELVAFDEAVPGKPGLVGGGPPGCGVRPLPTTRSPTRASLRSAGTHSPRPGSPRRRAQARDPGSPARP